MNDFLHSVKVSYQGAVYFLNVLYHSAKETKELVVSSLTHQQIFYLYLNFTHQVEPLKMSAGLCKSAQDWAEHLAKNDLFEHSDRSDIGENVAMHYSSATTEYSGKCEFS